MGIRIGCGSWGDQEYVGLLYPERTPPPQRLSEYAKHFDYVEVNSSYYMTPRRAAVEKWVNETPDGFLFDLKLHRNLLSSLKKAYPSAVPAKRKKKPEPMAEKTGNEVQMDLLAFLLEQVEPLIAAKKLGAFLLLLPSHFRPEKNRLEELDLLVEKIKPHRLAVEFRQSAWLSDENRANTLAYFRERGLTWVSVDMPRVEGPTIMPSMDEVTQPELAYLRLHGRNEAWLEADSAEERHTYLYGAKELQEIAERVQRLAAQAKNVRVVANNHAQDFAPKTALELKELLRELGEAAKKPKRP